MGGYSPRLEVLGETCPGIGVSMTRPHQVVVWIGLDRGSRCLAQWPDPTLIFSAIAYISGSASRNDSTASNRKKLVLHA